MGLCFKQLILINVKRKETKTNFSWSIMLLWNPPVGSIWMTKTLEEVFRHKEMHEFKKAEFAQMVREHLSSKKDVSNEITEVIKEIQKL